MFDNLFRLVGATWVVVPLVLATIAFGVVAIGLDASTVRMLARRS